MTSLSDSSAKHVRARFIQISGLYGLCGLVIVVAPLPELHWAYAFIWMLGPLGSLIYGGKFLLPFILGTTIIGAVFWLS